MQSPICVADCKQSQQLDLNLYHSQICFSNPRRKKIWSATRICVSSYLLYTVREAHCIYADTWFGWRPIMWTGKKLWTNGICPCHPLALMQPLIKFQKNRLKSFQTTGAWTYHFSAYFAEPSLTFDLWKLIFLKKALKIEINSTPKFTLPVFNRCFCFCVCLSVLFDLFHLYHRNQWTIFRQIWHTNSEISRIDCIKISTPILHK